MFTLSVNRIVKSLSTTAVLLFLTALLQVPAQADTLTIIGSSNTQDPVVGAFGDVGFLGQAFNNNFNVTMAGQTFDFVFGQFRIGPPSGLEGDSGCTDGPCLPITLTGNLTTPLGALSFGGFFEEADGTIRSLTVDWTTGSGPFVFTTPEGSTVVFTMELVDFFGSNSGEAALMFDQMARITILEFQPVPEPATMMLLGTGLAGLFAAARARKRSSVAQ